MSTHAHLSSIDALERFHNTLSVFIKEASAAVDEVSADVFRVKQWLENDKGRHWEAEYRKRLRRVEQTRQEVFRERLSPEMGVPDFQQMQLRKAEQALHEADEKLKLIRRWSRRLENETGPQLKSVENLRGYLARDTVAAKHRLASIITTLESYRDITPQSLPQAAGEPAVPPATDGITDESATVESTQTEKAPE